MISLAMYPRRQPRRVAASAAVARAVARKAAISAAYSRKSRVGSARMGAKGRLGFDLFLPFKGSSAARSRAAAYRRAGVAYSEHMIGRTHRRLVGRASRLMTTRPGTGAFSKGAMAVQGDEGVVCVKHREFLGVLNSSTDFETNVYDVNPGLVDTFPWLTGIANQFQQYQIRNMVFEFVSTAATSLTSGTNTALGQVAIASQYDSVQPEFLSLNDMLNSQFATSTKISSDLLHPLETEKYQTSTNVLYTRAGPPPPGADVRLYDLCRTTVATYGAQAANQIGQIWISYEICFFKPITYSQSGGDVGSAFISCLGDTGAPVSSANPLGTHSITVSDTIGVVTDFSDLTNPAIFLPPGREGLYQVEFQYNGGVMGSANNVNAGNLSLANCTLLSGIMNYPQSGINQYNGSGESYCGELVMDVQCFYLGCSFTILISDPSLPASIVWVGGGATTWILPGMNGSDATATVNILITQLASQFMPAFAEGLLDKTKSREERKAHKFAGMLAGKFKEVSLVRHDVKPEAKDDGEIVKAEGETALLMMPEGAVKKHPVVPTASPRENSGVARLFRR